MAPGLCLLNVVRVHAVSRARTTLTTSFARRHWGQCRHFAGRSSRGGSGSGTGWAGKAEEVDDAAHSDGGGELAAGVECRGGGASDVVVDAAAETTSGSPHPVSSLYALPLYRKPAFPGFYQIVQVSEQEVLDFLFHLRESGQGEYISGFMTKALPSHIAEPWFGMGNSSSAATPSPQVQGLNRDAGRVATVDELEEVGTELQVINLTQFPDVAGGQLVVMPKRRVRRTNVVSPPSPSTLAAVSVDFLSEPEVPEGFLTMERIKALHLETIATMKELLKTSFLYKEQFEQVIRFYDLDDPLKLADLVAGMSLGQRHELQAVLVEDDMERRLHKVLTIIKKDLEFTRMQSRVKSQVEDKASQEQRRVMLMAQMKHIAKELGYEKDDKESLIHRFRDAMKNKSISAEVEQAIEQELGKLQNIEASSSEFNVCRTYLEWLTALPWGQFTPENKDIQQAELILHEDHFGLEDVKERILEHMAVSFLKENVQGKIMCLVGPPGVGKTSIGKSIARALDRKFYRFSVGGMTDVAEVRGHRRTYVGAMPGKLIQGLKETQSSNPVVLIDEIDKLGRDHRGDPTSAFLEVLDPEQNSTFRDHYLDVPVDLSRVLFICTANVTDTIPGPLLDRMEVIRIAGYVFEEKVAIANQYLIPQTKQQSGIGSDRLELQDEALHKMITDYAREAGVRNLRKLLEKVSRKVALNLVRTPEEEQQKVGVSLDNLTKYIGQPTHLSDRLFPTAAPPGVVLGLAWTAMGGATLCIEARGQAHHTDMGAAHLNCRDAMDFEKSVVETACSSSFGAAGFGSMQVTGQLGSVMNESSSVSLTYARHFVRELDSANFFLDDARMHLNVPDGAVPKDGPSAGITMASALVSLALHKPVDPNLAMSGELTLTGKVLKVGGIKEKVIAARREGVTVLLLPRQNEADYAELKDYLRAGITAHFVDHYDDVYRLVFGQNQVLPLPWPSRGLPVVTMSNPRSPFSTEAMPLSMGITPRGPYPEVTLREQ